MTTTKLPSVEERNAAFERMSPAERRVAIAKDILAQLANDELEARTGSYVSGVYYEEDLHKPTYHCTVCAIGAAVVSAARLFDRVPSVYYSFNTLGVVGFRSLWLTDFFSQEQLALIESAFEGKDFSDLLSSEEVARAAAWGRQFVFNEERLRRIYQNIIRNKGEFILPKRFRPKAAS